MANLENLKSVDVRTVDRNTLIDIQETTVNLKLPKEERVLDFIKQIKNPYCYKVGKYIVKTSFSNTEETLQEKFENLLAKM